MQEPLVVPLEVLARCPGDPLAWAVYGLHTCYPELAQATMAEICGVHPGTVRRAIDRLRAVALLEPKARVSARSVPEKRAAALAPVKKSARQRAVRAPKARADARSEPRVRGREPFPELSLPSVETGTPSEPGPDAPNAAAMPFAAAIWEGKNPKPIISYGRLVKLVQRFLDAGWDGDLIVTAAIAAPTISENAVELQLNRLPRQPARADDSDRRAQPTGRIKL